MRQARPPVRFALSFFTCTPHSISHSRSVIILSPNNSIPTAPKLQTFHMAFSFGFGGDEEEIEGAAAHATAAAPADGVSGDTRPVEEHALEELVGKPSASISHLPPPGRLARLTSLAHGQTTRMRAG